MAGTSSNSVNIWRIVMRKCSVSNGFVLFVVLYVTILLYQLLRMTYLDLEENAGKKYEQEQYIMSGSRDVRKGLLQVLGIHSQKKDDIETKRVSSAVINNSLGNSVSFSPLLNISTKKDPLVTSDNRRYLCARYDIGRLGNQLFIYASAYGIASKTGLTLVIEDTNILRGIFPNLKAKPIPGNSSICKTVHKKFERLPNTYDESIYIFPKVGNVQLIAYLQSWFYFRDVQMDIRKQFQFKDDIMADATKRLQKAIKSRGTEGAEIVGIHVRRGDKLGKQAIAEGNLVATQQFFQKAMNYFRKELRNPVFVVVMSWHEKKDLEWVQNNIMGEDVVMLGDGSKESDLCVLSICNHTIISTGTFGWWGAWLCNGRTIYCKDFAVKGSEWDLYFSRNLKGYIIPGWIGM